MSTLLGVNEAAILLGVSAKQILQWTYKTILEPLSYHEGDFRYTLESIEAFKRLYELCRNDAVEIYSELLGVDFEEYIELEIDDDYLLLRKTQGM